MHLMKAVKKKRSYFREIYLGISLSFIVLQIVFSIAVSIQTSRSITEDNYRLNRQMFSQMNYNVSQSDDTIRNLCKNLYFDPDIEQMMNSVMEEDHLYDWIMRFEQICSPLQLSNPEIHSIYIYNHEMDRLFSSYRYLSYEDNFLREIFHSQSPPPILMPISRYLEDSTVPEGRTKVLSYLIYENIGTDGMPDGAIIINVKSEFITDNIRQMDGKEYGGSGNIIVFDNHNEIVSQQSSEEFTSAQDLNILTEYLDHTKFTVEDPFKMEELMVAGEKFVAFFTWISSTGWTVVKLQPYLEVYGYLTFQNLFIFLLTIISGIFMFVVAYWISRYIYRPVNKLVKKVEGFSDDKEENEFALLNKTYELMQSKISSYQKMEPRTNQILNSYYQRSLIIDSTSLDQATMNRLNLQTDGFIDFDSKYLLCVLDLDNYSQLETRYSPKDRKLLIYAWENITQEIFAENFQVMCIPLQNRQMVVVIKEASKIEDLQRKLLSINQNMQKYFEVSFSSSVSVQPVGAKKISESYSLTEKKLGYRYILGKACIITEDMGNQESSFQIEPLFSALKSHIQDRQKQKIQEDFTQMLSLLKHQTAENIPNLIMLFVTEVIFELTKFGTGIIGYAGESVPDIYANLMHLETWEEISDRLQTLIFDLIEGSLSNTQKSNLVSETIQEIIHEQYADPNLGIQQIADFIQKSPQYIGRLFKKETGESITNYINKLRLEKAVQLMISSKCTVTEVISKIGIENETQFYRLFKKEYGTSPKNYITEYVKAKEINHTDTPKKQ